MSKEKFVIKNTVGMFDLIKGIAMFFIISFHLFSSFPELISDFEIQYELSVLSILSAVIVGLISAIAVSIMPAFFVISGYGFRKRNLKKMIIQQARMMIIPYLITAAVTMLFHFCNHFLFFRYLPAAFTETLKVGLGFILGTPETLELNGYTIFSCGPVWFLLALYWGWLFFALIENYIKESWKLPVVIAAAAVGWGLSFIEFIPWCISQGLISVFYIYLGFYLKKKKILKEEHSVKQKILYLLLVIIPTIIIILLGGPIRMADNVYGFGLLTIIETGLFSYVIIYSILWLNRFTGKVAGFFRNVGQCSLYLFCIHTIEMIGFPWYVVCENVPKTWTYFFLISIIRFTIDYIVCRLFILIKNAITIFINKRKDQAYV